MKTLTDIHKEMHAEGIVSDVISAVNIDDIIWYAKARGVTKLGVLPSQLQPIWQFLSANIATDDIELRRQYLIEATCPRVLGVDIEVLPYDFKGWPIEKQPQ